MATKLGVILADFTTSLATALTVGATTATLQSAIDDDGNALPSGRYFFALDGDNSNKEHISCVLSGTSLTSINSLSRQGVEASGVLRAHRIGCTVTLTDFAHIKFINDLLLGATPLDATAPLEYDGTASITDPKQLATKAYADALAIAGAPDASTVTKGITKMSVAPVSATAPISVGDNDPRIVNYFAETGAANAYVITPTNPVVAAYATGQRFSFKAANTNTLSSTLNVNALGAKTIKKIDGATNLAAGDIVAGQIIAVEYDGTNFQMLNPVANIPLLASAVKYGGTGADGALAISSGTTTIDLGGASYFVKNYTSISITGTGQLTFTNPSANGCVVVLKSQGNVTITSSATPAILGDALGASAGNNGISISGGGPKAPIDIGASFSQPGPSTENTSATSGGKGAYVSAGPLVKFGVFSGAGGGQSDGGNVGAGGPGGIGIYIECGGAWNFTGSITSNGGPGVNGSGSSGWFRSSYHTASGGGGQVDGGTGSSSTTGTGTPTTTNGGGGGGGGCVVVLYKTLTANSGTITTNGGAAGTGTNSNGQAGGAGFSYVGLNTEYL